MSDGTLPVRHRAVLECALALGTVLVLVPGCTAERAAVSPTRPDSSESSHEAGGSGTDQPTLQAHAQPSANASADAGSAHPSSLQVQTGGTARLTQSDFKVAFYPGAVPDAERSQQLHLGATYSRTVVHSTRDPVKAVRAFYRKQLQASGQGRSIVETNDGDSVTMVMKRSETDVTMVVLERIAELGVVEITQQQLGEAAAR